MSKDKIVRYREDAETHGKLEKLAKKMGHKVSSLCRHIIRNYLKRHKI